MAELLVGAAAPVSRRLCGELMLAAAHHQSGTTAGPGLKDPYRTPPDAERIRAAMTGPPSEFEPPDLLLNVRNKWRLLQVRQTVSALSRGVLLLDDARTRRTETIQ